jgi:hypothetical protein
MLPVDTGAEFLYQFLRRLVQIPEQFGKYIMAQGAEFGIIQHLLQFVT